MNRQEWMERRMKVLKAHGHTTLSARRIAAREWASTEHKKAPGDIRVAGQ